ncbi:hypothetical protein LLH23_03380 [bacterium]|nr:hypothetical protein [bacterium]
MRVSQNLLFSGTAPGEEDPNLPAGESIAQMIERGLQARSWTIVEPTDLGDHSLWTVGCKRESAELEMTLAATLEKDLWMLQLAASYIPGLIARWRHKEPSATPEDVFSLAQDIHAILFASGEFRDPKWCWDNFPSDEIASPTPPAP